MANIADEKPTALASGPDAELHGSLRKEVRELCQQFPDAKRESTSRPSVGIVRVKTTGFNQDGTVVIEFKRMFMVYKRGRVPDTIRSRPPEPQAES